MPIRPTTAEELFVFNGEILNINDTISNFSVKSVYVPSWSKIKEEFYGELHPIVSDHGLRPCIKHFPDGRREEPSKIICEEEKLTTRNATQMGFTNAVSRSYDISGTDAEIALKTAQKDTIEKVYSSVRIDGENINRMYAYFAACEIITIWYAENTGVVHNEYGFPTPIKLRCRSYSPAPEADMKITQADIYPVFNASDDLIALAFKYDYTVVTSALIEKTTQYFEIYTADYHYQFSDDGSGWVQEEMTEIAIGKIPGVYLRRPQPVWEGIKSYRHEKEMKLSQESDFLTKNSAPIVVLSGTTIGEGPSSGYTREFYQVEAGGDIKLIAPAINADASTSFIKKLDDAMQRVTQFPELGQSHVVGEGIVSAAARETLLIPAHLRIGGESPDIEMFLSREGNIIKAFLGMMNIEWANTINDLQINHKVVPYSFQETTIDIQNMATGVVSGIVSQKTAIEYIKIASNSEAEIEQIKAELQEKIEAQNAADRLI